MFNSNASSADGAANYIEDVFSTYLYTGNGGSQTITNNIDLSTKGGMVWSKCRSNVFNHETASTAFANGYMVRPNTTGALDLGDVTGFTSSGYTLGYVSGAGNTNNYTYASWTFREQEKFFDVVTGTCDGSGNITVNHSLGATPGFVTVKRTDGVSAWLAYHTSLGNNQYVYLNATNAAATLTGVWNATSTTFTANVGFAAGAQVVLYLWASNAGGFGLTGTDNVISCGSYTGNGSATGPTVTLGYEPQWVMVKNVSAVGYWYMLDAMRGMSLTASNELAANSSAAENAFYGGTAQLAPQATGFQIINSGTQFNTSGQTYIYIAIRRGPMKVPTDGTKVFSPQTASGIQTTNFPVDFDLGGPRAGGVELQYAYDRLRGGTKYLIQTTTLAEQTGGSSLGFDSNTGVTSSWPSGYINWYFRRAPSFFDEVCYTGTGSARTVTHNLGVAPELIITKIRSTDRSTNWFTYSAATGAGYVLALNSTDASQASSGTWNNTSPTASVFSLGADTNANSNGATYVAYLFATCAGVSKVGSYTGTATTQQINCGFTAGARFVLIKRTDSTGDWYVYDSARGIVAGNDPYLLLNSTAAEVTSTDYVDTYAAGFELTSTAPAALNASGGTYIFLAIA